MGKSNIKIIQGGGNSDTKSRYVYIEKFIKTETLLRDWKLAAYEHTSMFAKMYDADTGGYLGSGHISDSQYIVTYVPLSFIAIPYGDILGEIYPVSSLAMDISFFTYLGVAVELV